MIGRVIAGRFTVLARLGAGAMGTVYRAKQAPIGREVAIKILRGDRAMDEASRARFLREARANSLLTSPNTVTVFDFGADDNGDFYLAMELLDGESLGQRIHRLGRIDPVAAVDTARQALRSLAEAHAKGIIHRDLKPDNLFFARVRTNDTYEEIVKVLDFGVAKMLHPDRELAMSVVETQAGTVFGTPRYMSPEQAQGKSLDTRSDLYSLGVILYQMLTGRPPFTDDDAVVVMARHIKTTPRAMSDVAPDAAVPCELEASVMLALSKEPDLRPQTAEAMAADLAHAIESFGAPSPVSSGVRVSLAPSSRDAASRQVRSRLEAVDEVAAVAALRPRRWPWSVAGAAAAMGVGLVIWHASPSDVPAAPSPSNTAARIGGPAPSAPPPVTPRQPAAVQAPTTPPSPSRPAASSSSSSLRAPPTLPAVRVAPSGSRRSVGRGASPTSSASVDYGYLE